MERHVGLASHYPQVMGLGGDVKQGAGRQFPRTPVVKGCCRPTLQDKPDVLKMAPGGTDRRSGIH